MISLLCLLGLASGSSSPGFVNRFPSIRKPIDFNAGVPASDPVTIGDITEFAAQPPNAFEITSGTDALRVQFYREDVVRIWLGWAGNFTDDASEDIVVGVPLESLSAQFVEESDHYEMRATPKSDVTLRATKSPLRFSMYKAGQLVWSETVGLSRNGTASFQTMAAADDEYFFGGGMQNGRFSHKGHRIRISTDENWADGGNPNAAPMYMSTAGFAVYRNTWSPGFYDFSSSPAVLSHNESRFDAFFAVSAPRDFKGLLEGYTFVTGRPFMPPAYALGLGDSDCYHNDRHGSDTHVAIAVAAKYREMDMPGAWILPNDGYGCGYGSGSADFPTDFDVLDEVVAGLHSHGFEGGLWSSTGLPNITREVSGSGARIFKTDVGWIGDGYKYAFDSVKQCVAGIEDNSDARRHIWTVEGWAGTQRLAVMWTGDDSGSFEYIRWQIPTYVGCGFSAQAHVSGDVDGIFGGSPESYVRDLQFKAMMTVVMTMSGWAGNPDKQPWTWGEPYTSINRMYLKLKSRLTPYFYTLSREAFDTGVPPVRAMALEFPEDDATLVNSTGTSQQFMAGPSFLVAPVYRPLNEGGSARDGIYLPEGEWIDYWDGSIVSGPKTVDGYDSPLQTLPLFVRAGAIVPMWPEMNFPGEKPANPLTLDVFPKGESSFQLYEDDGKTRAALEGSAFATTDISCSAQPNTLRKGGRVNVTVGASVGSFAGQLEERVYDVRVHMGRTPSEVLLHGAVETSLPEQQSLAALDYAASGWFFCKVDKVVHVKTPSISTASAFTVELSTGPLVPHISLQKCTKAASQTFEKASDGRITLRGDTSSCMTASTDKDLDSGTPALEMQACDASKDDSQQWMHDEVGRLHLLSDANNKSCIDLDRSDRMAEMYGCRAASVNQMYVYDPAYGSFTISCDGTCMTTTQPMMGALEVVLV